MVVVGYGLSHHKDLIATSFNYEVSGKKFYPKPNYSEDYENLSSNLDRINSIYCMHLPHSSTR